MRPKQQQQRLWVCREDSVGLHSLMKEGISQRDNLAVVFPINL